MRLCTSFQIGEEVQEAKEAIQALERDEDAEQDDQILEPQSICISSKL